MFQRAAKLLGVDRDDTLRNAEKLLRQGRLSDSIAQYKKLVDETPDDWAAANSLGDLYVRAGSIDEAAAQYTRIADHFLEDGFLPKAVALYKKILRIRPDEETCLLRLGEIAAQQGLLVDAKAHLTAVRDQRLQRGDERGAMEILVKLGSVDPADMEARLAGTRALADMGERDKAVTRMTELAAELTETGQGAEALAALQEAARFDPENTEVGAAIARAVVASGDLEAARQHLTREVAGDDPELMVMFCELELTAGRVDSAAPVLRALAESASEQQRVVGLANRLAATDVAAAFVCAEAVVDVLVAGDDWPGAAQVLEAFAKRAPHHAPTLLRLVEVCVDGGLDSVLYAAQARLAEAYLQEGRAFEARVISEDLAVREPGVGSHIDRLRRALVMTGEGAPDRVIAQRLSEAMLAVGSDQPSSIMDDRTSQPEADPVPTAPEPVPAPQPVATQAPQPIATPSVAPPQAAVTSAPGPIPVQAATAAAAVTASPGQPAEVARPGPSISMSDLEAALNSSPAASAVPSPAAPAAPSPARRGPSGEVDLSSALTELTGPSAVPQASVPAAGCAPAAPSAPTPTAVPSAPTPTAVPSAATGGAGAEGSRDAAPQQTAADLAAQQYKLALTYRDMGMIEEAITALELSSRSPAHRFASAAALGRLLRDRQAGDRAIYWFERAAEAPAPSPEEGYELLYELGDLLERTLESARALAVFMELHADAGEYRDVAARAERLTRVVTGG